jgi:hypothetical protein
VEPVEPVEPPSDRRTLASFGPHQLGVTIMLTGLAIVLMSGVAVAVALNGPDKSKDEDTAPTSARHRNIHF